MEAPKFSKRKKLGKNKKKSWRGIDITKTEEFLEDQRFQLRTTGLLAKKTDEQLFSLDRVVGDDSEATPTKKPQTELRCYTNLRNSSLIPCPRNDSIASRAAARRLGKVPTRLMKKNEAQARKRKAPFQKSGDLWGETQEQAAVPDDGRVRNIKVPKHIQRTPSARSAVEVPHPGSSYNPSYEDHQNLLLEAYVKEIKWQKAEQKVFNALDARFPSKAPTEADWVKEMSAGLFDKKQKRSRKTVEDEEADNERISINPPVSREKKKTPRDKRKERAAKLLEEKALRSKSKKQSENKVFSIPTIRSELSRSERAKKKKEALRAQKLEEKKFATKKLGKRKFEAPDMDLKLSSELVGNLRSVKPEGHLLEDRYKSLQQRNILEPREKVFKKKTKTKSFEKKSFREVTL